VSGINETIVSISSDSTKMAQQKTQYYSEMNYLRGLAILFVISNHISDYFSEMTNINLLAILYMALSALAQAAVPAFVFISGFLLYNNNNIKLETGTFYIKRFRYILPPYIIFSALYIIFDSKINDVPLNLNPLDILIKYLTGGAYYHLWFFVLITQLYLLYPLILKTYVYFENKNNISLFLTIIFIMGILGSYFLGDDFLFANSTQFIGYLFYFVFGMFIKSHHESIKLKSFLRKFSFCVFILLLLGTIFIVADSANDYFSYNLFNFDSSYEQILEIFNIAISTLYFTTIFIVMLYVSLTLSKSKKLPTIDKIGSDSFALYLVHPMILEVVVDKLSDVGFDWNNLLFYPSVFILTLILSMLSVKIIQQIPSHNYIIGRSSTS
jgi:probable poly-beta-1,6-N-acetyl-D-glucosamine export protein